MSLRIVLLVHPREPFGPPWVILVDLEAAEDRPSVSLSLVEQAELDGPHGRLHAVANSKLGADVP